MNIQNVISNPSYKNRSTESKKVCKLEEKWNMHSNKRNSII